MTDELPSWRPGATTTRILAFLDESAGLPIHERVAAFDNDGTLWTEKPVYAQLAFFVHELQQACIADPTCAERPEYAAVLTGDMAAIGRFGLPRVATALAELFQGIEPTEFAERVRHFLTQTQHPTLGRPWHRTVYQPMLELIDELRRRSFTIFIVTGGGTEFVRAVSQEVYGVEPERVVGTLIGYEYTTRDGRPLLVRTGEVFGDANEGAAKVLHIQQQLGRRPVFAAGNTAGDRQMIEWATGGAGPSLGLLVHHDDPVREAAYEGEAATFESRDRITDVAEQAGWAVARMAEDWLQVFPD